MKPTDLKSISYKIGTKTESGHFATGVAVDTRLLRKGDLFFALPGILVDGHSFLGAAAAAGAIGAVVQNNYRGPDFGMPLLHVQDVLAALQNLAKKNLMESQATIIAVTGSLGKTTTKEFIACILKNKFKVAASPGNSNSQIGLPIAILNHTSGEEEVVVLEMGMTQSGQLKKLIEIAPPDIAVITTVALVHAENFDTLDEIGQAKAEIFSNPATRLGIYHLESDMHSVLTQSGICEKRSFSTTGEQADCFLEMTENNLWMRISDRIDKTTCSLPLLEVPGQHNRHNFLAAIAVARALKMDWDEIKESQMNLQLPERRLQLFEREGVLFVNDAYNASELSMKGAMDSLPEPKQGCKRIAFLGGMVELGKFSDGCHRSVGKHALDKVDLMLCFGNDCLPILEEWEKAGRKVIWAREREELVGSLRQHLEPGDVVLLKGSRAKGVWNVLDEVFAGS